ncbi:MULTISPECIES: tetratricopeptide repeat protein [Streptomycetaceae]|uniref:Tetratricopeptide repeat protein n=1 Tax=Streptantibioticus cattleyicolor (strain ATCC 35852 / DSM 46488 / JCM 4925 / NBRC 14057 / NRRL 8057) TaxID=1003195 RepID=F8JNZ1_STREN|nr:MULTISPECIES: tetratricopeptide repeat protein [Streptomycetaceae]AEW93932.1 hypothetical protein SCATT_15610 [Streptantibioticus cattleyicolor NRRL 8057 = DSM 46488]MYS58608.1 tetratricopeptide repeat protein [Streptomyces sp. SID5468]CCB74278.1 protein of unknown function [Streptantibioticus cattleyicolor NRRL 8057 = DSM 46488]
MIDRLSAALERAGVELSTQELLDVLWLAVRTGGAPAGTGEPPAGPAPAATARPPRPPADAAEPEPPAGSEAADPARPADPGLYAPGPRPPRGGRTAVTVQVRGVRALTRAHRLGRALRPLRQWSPSPRLVRLDESASADRIAETGLPDVVLRPEREHRLSLTLIVDDGPSMVLWRQLAAELRAILERLGAFRQLRILGLDTGDAAAPVLRARPFAPAAPRRTPGSVVGQEGRTVVLVLSDGVGPAWRSGAVQRWLARWARRVPVAVVQPLPPRMWPAPAMAAERLLLAAERPVAANRCLTIHHPLLPSGLLAPYEGVPVPLLELAEEQLAAWAGLAAGDRGSAALPVLLLPAHPPPPVPVPDPPHRAPGERLRHFRESASPEGQRLAGRLAAVHPLTLPVMRLIHHAGRQDPGGADRFHPAQLAEVFLGGLLRRAEGAGGTYEFQPGVADLLLDTVRTDEALGTVELVTAYLTRRRGDGPEFRARVHGPGGTAVTDDARPFAAASPQLLYRLSLGDGGGSGRGDPADAGTPSPVPGEPVLSHASLWVRPPLTELARRIVRDPSVPGAVREQAARMADAAGDREEVYGWDGVHAVQELAVRLVDTDLTGYAGELRRVIGTLLPELTGDDLETRNLRGHLALALNRLGDHDQAEHHLREVVAVSVRVHGPEHRYTLYARGHLAGLLSAAGRLEAAEAERRELLEVYLRRPEFDVVAVGESRSRLAQVLQQRERHQEALDEYRRAHHDCLAALGPDHPETLGALWWVGHGLERARRYPEAEEAYRELLDAWTRTAGPDQEDALMARAGLVRVLMGDRRYARAEPELRELVAAAETRYGPRDPRTLDAREDLAVALRDLDRPDDALAVTTSLVPAATRVFGTAHPVALRMRYVHATVLNALERYSEAETECLGILAEELRLGRPEGAVLTTRLELARAVRGQERLAEAEEGYREVARARARLLGEEHDSTLAARHGWAQTLGMLGRHEEAEAELRRVLEARRRVLGADHPDTSSTRAQLVWTLLDQERFTEAEAEQRALTAERAARDGDDAPRTLSSRHNLGYLLNRMGRYAEAEQVNRRAWRDRRRVLGADNPLTLGTWHNLAFSLDHLGRLAEAEAEYAAVLEARGRVLGPHHRNTEVTRGLLEDLRRRIRLSEE